MLYVNVMCCEPTTDPNRAKKDDSLFTSLFTTWQLVVSADTWHSLYEICDDLSSNIWNKEKVFL